MKDPTSVAEALERIADRNGGTLDPVQVVKVAEDPKSILHSHFTWDDSEAAHQFRLEEARKLIRVTISIIPKVETPERVWISLNSDRGENGYRKLVSVLSDSDLRAQLLEEAKSELNYFRRKYGRLTELAKVFEVLDKL